MLLDGWLKGCIAVSAGARGGRDTGRRQLIPGVVRVASANRVHRNRPYDLIALRIILYSLSVVMQSNMRFSSPCGGWQCAEDVVRRYTRSSNMDDRLLPVRAVVIYH